MKWRMVIELESPENIGEVFEALTPLTVVSLRPVPDTKENTCTCKVHLFSHGEFRDIDKDCPLHSCVIYTAKP